MAFGIQYTYLQIPCHKLPMSELTKVNVPNSINSINWTPDMQAHTQISQRGGIGVSATLTIMFVTEGLN